MSNCLEALVYDAAALRFSTSANRVARKLISYGDVGFMSKDWKALSDNLVLVTGGSGFIATYCLIHLLRSGYRVRATVRDLSRVPAMWQSPTHDQLSFVVASLDTDEGWSDAVRGCTYVLHVASPFPDRPPKHDDDLIKPARNGTLRVLNAALNAGVRRVVLTSSFAAVGFGHPERSAPFTESDWTDLEGRRVSAYVKSKTLAERAAWDFHAQHLNDLELCAINPVEVFGPVFGPGYPTTILLIQRALEGALPGVPKLFIGAVDVQDVADLHLRAMTNPLANGERFIATGGGCISLLDVARILKRNMGSSAKQVPLRELPDLLVRLASLKEPALRLLIPELGIRKDTSSSKAQRLLGWHARSPEACIMATAESLIRHGLVCER